MGWYSTGPKLRENDLDIHGLFNEYVWRTEILCRVSFHFSAFTSFEHWLILSNHYQFHQHCYFANVVAWKVLYPFTLMNTIVMI